MRRENPRNARGSKEEAPTHSILHSKFGIHPKYYVHVTNSLCLFIQRQYVVYIMVAKSPRVFFLHIYRERAGS
ncbi:hypothetical protein Mp_8g04660 [Marchantia polymorpha subsp. ruderalis]|uniref:Uncharacterized protein n=1 Tax=Marchantia polymorpha TaxID=3197 RepID=A0A2R6W1J0_MARPO|nr:hypothetical protein MARPO_0186s0015 [Marchantia polymorpha]BBN18695.1 hypothetical protein Mp_8g04660 [Marchantia polymorpha subsp. ruderalis]|eukprot:PTQ27716.1 hypothetical protein MARPO_0186s0015 [Marchantia polymorpha]